MDDTPDNGLLPVGTVTEYAVTVFDWPMGLERLRVRVIGDSLTDTPRLCLELTPETSIKDIEALWSTVTFWRDAVFAAWPEERIGDSLRRLITVELDQRHNAGESYAKLAAWITERVVDALRIYLAWLDGDDTAPSSAWLDLDHPRYGWVAAMELLRWFGPQRQRDPYATDPASDDNRAAILKAALEALRSGRPAFDEAPIQPENVKDRLRVWRAKAG